MSDSNTTKSGSVAPRSTMRSEKWRRVGCDAFVSRTSGAGPRCVALIRFLPR